MTQGNISNKHKHDRAVVARASSAQLKLCGLKGLQTCQGRTLSTTLADRAYHGPGLAYGAPYWTVSASQATSTRHPSLTKASTKQSNAYIGGGEVPGSTALNPLTASHVDCRQAWSW